MDDQKSLEYFQQALEMRQKILPENHPDIVSSLDNLGASYSCLGEHQKSLEYYQHALEMRRKILPENHPDISSSLNNMR